MNTTTKQSVSYPDRLRNVKKNSQTLAAAQPTVMTFEKFHQAACATGALDRGTKELMALQSASHMGATTASPTTFMTP
jgi:alkylhydroperoxidase/carboxymuconolactone decarboxylase family protein YurZ